MEHQLKKEEIHRMIDQAIQGKENAYVPYSKYPVGASVLAGDECIYTGCNVENASYGLTNCAERTAIFKAVSEGNRTFSAMAVIADSDRFASPCGACRQVIMEFGAEADIILVNDSGEYQIVKGRELLPGAFTSKDLENR